MFPLTDCAQMPLIWSQNFGKISAYGSLKSDFS